MYAIDNLSHDETKRLLLFVIGSLSTYGTFATMHPDDVIDLLVNEARILGVIGEEVENDGTDED